MNEEILKKKPVAGYETASPFDSPLAFGQNPKTLASPVTTTMSAETLGVTPKPVIPQPQNTVVDSQSIISSLTPAPVVAENTALKEATARQKAINERISGLLTERATAPTFQAGQEQALGIPQQQRDIQELSNQLNILRTEAQAIPLQVQQESMGRGITRAGIAPIESARNRENAIQALTVSSALQAKQGNLALALSQADRATKLKYDAIDEQIANEERNLALFEKIELTPLQEQALEERKLALEARKLEEKDKKEIESDFNKRLIEAQNRGLANTNTAQARNLFNAGRIDEANAILAQFSPEQIRIQQTRTTPGGEVVTTESLTGIPSQGTGAYEKDQLISDASRLKLNEGQANSLSFAIRLMESNKKLNKMIEEGYDPTTIVSGLGRFVESDKARAFRRELENFTRAQLRKESGATITDEEIEGALKLYDPSGFGKDEGDITATSQNRLQAIQSMITQAGPASRYLNQYLSSIGTGESQAIGGTQELDKQINDIYGRMGQIQPATFNAASFF